MKIEYQKNAAFFPEKDICVISDLHIGLEEKLINQGISFPFNELKQITENLEEIIETYKPSKIIYNGDILHKFSGIPSSVPKKLDKLLTLQPKHIFIQGSHDTMLQALLEKREIKTHRYYAKNGILFTHGDKKIDEIELKNYELLVIGHEHPAIEIQGEKRNCFLYKENCIKKTDILIIPTFSTLTEGVKINNLRSTDLMSPYLKGCELNKFKVIVEVEDEVLFFPEIGKFREKL